MKIGLTHGEMNLNYNLFIDKVKYYFDISFPKTMTKVCKNKERKPKLSPDALKLINKLHNLYQGIKELDSTHFVPEYYRRVATVQKIKTKSHIT